LGFRFLFRFPLRFLRFLLGATLAVAAFVLCSALGWTQQAPAAAAAAPGDTASAVRDLQDQVRQLRSLVEEMRAENAESRAEMHQLRHDLESTRALLEHPATSASGATVAAASPENGSGISTGVAVSGAAASGTIASGTTGASIPPLEERVQKLEESTSLIGSKIDEQYQTKVESASKYRARLHGIVLMNAFRNVGGSDNLDFPDYSQPVSAGSPQATLGATMRQSEIGLEVFGPNIGGARTSANVQLDFAGGFPATGNGVNFGIVRLQTADVRFDWGHTSVVAGQDALFISPLSPTSFASLATPAFAFAGNLWGWTPQLRVEHRFSVSDQQTVTVQAGILDNLDWEYPSNPFYRSAQAGEMSGQPAYAFRTAWSRPVWERPLSIGVAGYYGRQDWTWNRFVDAYAGMADWQIPIIRRLGLSGEFYRGRGIGGLGGAIGTSIVYGGNPAVAYTPIRGLNTAGGWSQLKFQLTPKLELNGVIAEDDAFAGDVRGFANDENNFGPILGRNRGALGNVVFRPRSDLLLSAEFRRLHTFPIYDSSSSTNQVNLSVGILF
jgi:prefoldin subunit 5